MAKVINGIAYPDHMVDILADGTLKDAFLAFARRTDAEENIDFVRASDGRIGPELVYNSFLSMRGTRRINISSAVRARADALATRQPSDWRPASWTGVFEDARAEIIRLTNGSTVGDFWKSREFLDIHELALRRQIKGLDKAASLLGIKNKRLLEELLFRVRLDGPNSAEAKTASDKLIAAEKLSMKRDALLKALEGGRFI